MKSSVLHLPKLLWCSVATIEREEMTEELKKPTLFLIDGSNYIYRAFYAIRELSNSKGFPTNAIYGFTNMLMKLCRDREPDYIVVVFDSKGPTFRHEAYGEYKANRKAMPDELIPQIPKIKEVVRGFSIPVLEEAGMEADDIIGTLVKKYSGADVTTVIISGDKDLMQLVSEDVLMLDTMKDKTYDIEGVKERFGVGPEKVVDILGLAGDSSDNVPGVPGVGEKTAQKLVKEFGGLEGILNNLDKVKGAKLKENLTTYADQARLSRELVTIRTDATVDVGLDKMKRSSPDTPVLKELFKEFEFMSFLHALDRGGKKEEIECRVIFSEKEFAGLVEELKRTKAFSFCMELTSPEPMKAEIVGISICHTEGGGFYIPLAHDYAEVPKQLPLDAVLAGIAPFLSDETITKHGYDMKNASIVCSRKGIWLKGMGIDVMVASYVLNPTQRDFSLEGIAGGSLDLEINSLKDVVGSGVKAISFSSVPIEKAAEFSCGRADCVWQLARHLSALIEKEGFGDLFYKIEMPLISVLADMERKGVLLDIGLLHEMSEELREIMLLSEDKIYKLAGKQFNINSPKQLQTILFDKLGLPKGRKTKGGYSTDVEVLTYLAQSYELPAEILAYRSFAKLRSTYVEALPALLNRETGRVHTSYNQTVTATGRLSSSNPNLQNIPIRTMEGKRIRQAFIVPEGHEIVSADYSQIELRVLAHLSEDEELLRAFESGEDIHTRTASNIFGVFPDMVNEEMRRLAKVINFGIIYGMSPFGLSKELGITQKLAKTYIDEYFHRFHGVKRFIETLLDGARKNGFVTTLLGRRRYIPEINSRNVTVRQFAERMAMNAPIQGTAADIIKIAMLDIASSLKEKNLSSSMIMQVHDELVFEVPEGERHDVIDLVRNRMEGVITLKVPLIVEIYAGKNWDEAH
jgi:DNA polymerase-1